MTRTVAHRKTRKLAPVLLLALLPGCGSPEEGEDVVVQVPAGATFEQVADTLEARGLVGRRGLFRLYARSRGAETEIRAGTYSFPSGAGWGSILDKLTTGRVMTVPMTVPEGFTLKRMAGRIAEVTGVPEDSVHAILSGYPPASVMVPGPGLEGYLFPDTYRFTPGTSVERVIRTMASRYRAVWTPSRLERRAALGLSEGEVVTLASIVQAEARLEAEMVRISGVYHNRLRIRMPLQADPTVLYALGGWRERLLDAAKDSVADDPYNTYTHPGLPPGPIGAPGEAAIDAALNPAETDDLYFVARPGGEHIFSRTLREHNAAVAQARRERDALRRGQGEPAFSMAN